MKSDTSSRFRITKTDDERRLVFGWANVAMTTDGRVVLDRQGDMIDPDDLEEAAYRFVLSGGDANERHTEKSVGQLVESFAVTPEKLEGLGLRPDALPRGWWVGFYVADEDAFAKVKSGEYRALSIEGTATREDA